MKLCVKLTKDTPRHPHIGQRSKSYKVKNVHNMLSHGDTPICQFGMPVSKSKDDLARLKFMVKA